MQTYWIDTRKEDKELFSEYSDKLTGRIPLFLQITNGLVGGFEVTDWKKDEINVGFVYLQKQEDGNFMQNVYLRDNTDAGNIAIEVLDTLLDQNLVNQIDIKYVFDETGNDPVMAILVLAIGEYGMLQEDLYSVYFTGHSIRKYGYMREDYYERNFTDEELAKESPKVAKYKKTWFRNFVRRIFGK